jgi:hypothetical protein
VKSDLDYIASLTRNPAGVPDIIVTSIVRESFQPFISIPHRYPTLIILPAHANFSVYAGSTWSSSLLDLLRNS